MRTIGMIMIAMHDAIGPGKGDRRYEKNGVDNDLPHHLLGIAIGDVYEAFEQMNARYAGKSTGKSFSGTGTAPCSSQ